VGGHYFIIPSLSIGGTIGYEDAWVHDSPAQWRDPACFGPKDDASNLRFNPKVGYVLP